jgi:integrase
MKTTFKFYTGRLKKSGQVPIYFQVTINRQKKRFNLDIDSVPGDLSVKKDRIEIKKSDSEYQHKNQIIDQAMERALSIRRTFSYNGELLTLCEFNRCFDKQAYGTESFYTYAESKRTELTGIRAEATIQFYYKQISKMKRFRPVLKFAEVNMDFMQGYKAYMITKLFNQESTWNKSLEFVKRIMNKAHEEGLIQANPIKRQVISRTRSRGEYLTREEIRELENKYQGKELAKKYRPVLRYFLFSCYTGLRYGDIKKLRFINIKTIAGNKWIQFIQQKTSKATRIPIIPQALNLLPETGAEQQRVFRVLTNQPTNRYLKEIMTVTGIDKHITFHASRRTCSNLLLFAGVPLEVRCMIIGDTKDVIMGHYTAEDEALKMQYMAKLSEVLETKPA